MRTARFSSRPNMLVMWPVMHAGKPTHPLRTDWQTRVKTLPCPKLHLRAVTIHNLNFKLDIDVDVADKCNLSLFLDRFNKGITFVDICEHTQIIALKNVLVNVSVINVDIDIGENYSAEIMGYAIMKLHEITSWVTIICIFSNIQWDIVDFLLAKCSDFLFKITRCISHNFASSFFTKIETFKTLTSHFTC